MLTLPARLALAFIPVLLAACNQAPPSWDTLVTKKISEQYPGYTVTPAPPGVLLVERPGRSAVPVDVDAIAKFCLRGTKDCDYAMDQLLQSLR